MNKKTQLITILSIIAVTIISGIVIIVIPLFNKDRGSSLTTDVASASDLGLADPNNNDSTYIPPTPKDDNDFDSADTELDGEDPDPFIPATEMDLDPTSITVFVNKEYALPKDYKPEKLVTPDVKFNLTYYDDRTLMRPEAASALEKLFAAASEDGYTLCGISGYRSYNRQKEIFLSNIVSQGKAHTLKYSAVPGTSEHQTGLAIDLSTESQGYKLSTSFSESPEGIWLSKNAHRYGYIIRYPKGKADITGYAYEPWHIRYVGKGLANYLYTNDLTLDEYYKYTPSPDFDFEALYAELINYLPPTISVTPPADGVIIGDNGEIIEGGVDEEIDDEGDGETDGEGDEGTDGDDTEDDITDPTDPSDIPSEGEITPTITDVPPESGDTEDPSSGNIGGAQGGTLTPSPVPTPTDVPHSNPETGA